MRVLMMLLLVFLAGCSTLVPVPEMSADQLKAAASDKNFSAVCSQASGLWGSAKVVYVNVDRSVVVNGTAMVGPDCIVTMTNEPPPKALTKGVTP